MCYPARKFFLTLRVLTLTLTHPARAAKVGVASPSSEAASRTVHVKLDAKVVGYRLS